MPTSWMPLLLGVADLLDELPVDERLAVVVHAHVRDAELRALVDDLAEQVDVMTPWRRCMSSRGQNTHLALQMFVLSIWTISGQHRGAVAARSRAAAGGPASPAGAAADSAARARARLEVPEGMQALLLAEVLDHARQDLVELDGRLVADERA